MSDGTLRNGKYKTLWVKKILDQCPSWKMVPPVWPIKISYRPTPRNDDSNDFSMIKSLHLGSSEAKCLFYQIIFWHFFNLFTWCIFHFFLIPYVLIFEKIRLLNLKNITFHQAIFFYWLANFIVEFYTVLPAIYNL